MRRAGFSSIVSEDKHRFSFSSEFTKDFLYISYISYVHCTCTMYILLTTKLLTIEKNVRKMRGKEKNQRFSENYRTICPMS